MSFKTAMGFSVRRKTIAVFFVLLLLGLLLYNRSREQSVSAPEMLALDGLLQQKIDSLKAIEQPKTIYPFNPNFISDQRGYFLDLSPQEIDRLHAYREQGKWINSVREFQKVTGVDSTWLKAYSPFFNFPARVKKEQKKDTKKSFPPIDLNTATADELRQIYGIGEVLSQRIIRYRERLQGFAKETQLAEVYGLSPEVLVRLQSRCSIITQPAFEKIALQEASLQQLSKLPYLSYAEARKVVRLRTELKQLSLVNLHSIKGFDSLKIKRLALYLF